MKNLIIFILIVTVVVTGFVAAKSTLRMSVEGLEGKTEIVVRGDLSLPINAVGEIHPFRRVEIKSEASGEVIEIAKHAGDRVSAGDLIIRLQKDDEQRFVNSAGQDVEMSGFRQEEAKIALQQAKTAGLQTAEAQVMQAEQNLKFAKFRKDKLDSLPEHQRNPEETLERLTTYHKQVAALKVANANLETATLNIPKAEQVVKQAESAFQTAKNNLADAEKRLAETDIISPLDGIVADIRTQIGEVIQGGKTTLTGGTVLAVLLDVDRLIVKAEVDESDIGRVLKIAPPWARPGHDGSVQMPANLTEAAGTMEHLPVITVESFRNDEFTGIIERVFPEARKLSNVVTYLVDVVIVSENKDQLLPGMRADVGFTSEFAANVVLCPNEAIKEGPNGKLGVYIPKESESRDDHAVQFVQCRFGLDNGNYNEVIEGLAEGDVVYTKLPARRDRDRKKK